MRRLTREHSSLSLPDPKKIEINLNKENILTNERSRLNKIVSNTSLEQN